MKEVGCEWQIFIQRTGSDLDPACKQLKRAKGEVQYYLKQGFPKSLYLVQRTDYARRPLHLSLPNKQSYVAEELSSPM